EAAGSRAGSAPPLERAMPELHRQLGEVFTKLERHYRDMQDVEFTIQKGRLWVLQTRSGKRTALAMVRIAVEMLAAGLIDEAEATERVDAGRLPELLVPSLDQQASRRARNAVPVHARGRRRSHSGALSNSAFAVE